MKIGLINIALSLYNNGKFKRTKNILDLGTKELRVSFDQIENAFKQTKINFKKEKFKILKKFPKGKRISTKIFWNELGISDYNCSDINKKSKMYIDLNFPLKNKDLINKFDLVTDFGNNEHVFNVGQAYKNMYQLCKKNGYMWIFQAVYGGNGFFNYDMSFFEGMAAANNLSVVYSCYLVQTTEYEQFIIPCNKDLFNVLDLTKIKSVGITYIFRKNSIENFKYYYQYNVNNNGSPFEIMYLNNELSPEKIYVPTKKIGQLKKSAKKGDKSSINWLRALGYKI